jgi:integrase
MHAGARPLETHETKQLLATFNGQYRFRNRAIVQTGLYTGLRLGSLLALRIGDVWDGKKFRDRVRVARRNLKGKHAGLAMPLHPSARFAIGRWLVALRRSGAQIAPHLALFGSREGGKGLSRRRAQEIINEAAWKAGLGFGVSTHSWRKTFACRLYEATGHDLLVVSRALHHRQLSTSLHYLGWALEQKADAAILGL